MPVPMAGWMPLKKSSNIAPVLTSFTTRQRVSSPGSTQPSPRICGCFCGGGGRADAQEASDAVSTAVMKLRNWVVLWGACHAQDTLPRGEWSNAANVRLDCGVVRRLACEW